MWLMVNIGLDEVDSAVRNYLKLGKAAGVAVYQKLEWPRLNELLQLYYK